MYDHTISGGGVPPTWMTIKNKSHNYSCIFHLVGSNQAKSYLTHLACEDDRLAGVDVDDILGVVDEVGRRVHVEVVPRPLGSGRGTPEEKIESFPEMLL